jgi:predicted lipoprotein with Yx(FWY)xxD motif
MEAAMIKRDKAIYLLAATGALAGLSACGIATLDSATQEKAVGAIVVAAGQTAEAPATGGVPDGQGGASSPEATETPETTETPEATETPVEDAPVPEPTVAKVQKWVKIYSGPSAKDIQPPKTRAGSRTVELDATEQDTIGTYLTDGAGRALYRFDNDSAKPPKATCNGDCATAWPPLLIKSPGKIFPKGVDPKILGYVERADHTCQVTVNGWPVYYFVADKPGDVNGQGINGKWFAISPTGGKTKPIPGFPLGK